MADARATLESKISVRYCEASWAIPTHHWHTSCTILNKLQCVTEVWQLNGSARLADQPAPPRTRMSCQTVKRSQQLVHMSFSRLHLHNGRCRAGQATTPTLAPLTSTCRICAVDACLPLVRSAACHLKIYTSTAPETPAPIHAENYANSVHVLHVSRPQAAVYKTCPNP